MELIKTRYRILFSLEVTLVGYPDDSTRYIKIIPDPPTSDLFPVYRILSRKQKNTKVILILVEPEGTTQDVPEIPLQPDEVFRFYIKIPDRDFLSRTHIAGYDLNTNMLSLSNEVNHVAGTEILLSRPIDSYSSSDNYEPGYLVRSGSNFFRAIQASNSGDPHPVTDPDYWSSIPSGTFVSQADLQPRSTTVDLDSLIVVDIKHSVALPSDYQLLDGDSKCKEVNYKIKLLS